MGLDITAHRGARPAALIGAIDPEYDEDAYDQHYELGHDFAWVNDDFPGRNGSIAQGFYEVEESFSFRAGSYSGYGQWRANLCAAALHLRTDDVYNYPIAVHGLPFIELINFADNEGTIGPEASQRLHDDFVKERERVRTRIIAALDERDSEYFMQKYDDWTRAFDLARQGGFVSFH